MKKLLCLDISLNHAVSDALVSGIGLMCPMIKCLNLAGCPFIHDRGLIAMLAGCGDLEALNLSGCSTSRINITDKSMVQLGKYCPRITRYKLPSSIKCLSSRFCALFLPFTQKVGPAEMRNSN